MRHVVGRISGKMFLRRCFPEEDWTWAIIQTGYISQPLARALALNGCCVPQSGDFVMLPVSWTDWHLISTGFYNKNKFIIWLFLSGLWKGNYLIIWINYKEPEDLLYVCLFLAGCLCYLHCCLLTDFVLGFTGTLPWSSSILSVSCLSLLWKRRLCLLQCKVCEFIYMSCLHV